MRMAATKRRVMMLALCIAVQLSGGTSRALSFTTGSLKGRWTVRLDPATSFGDSALGNPAGVTAAPRQHIMRVGYIDWTGTGTASGRFIATTDTNAGQTMTIDYKWSGTYTVSSDGTGSLSITAIELLAPPPTCTPNPPPEGGVCTDYIAPSPLSPIPAYVGPETFAFVIAKQTGSVTLVQQNNNAGAKISLQGEAVRQFRITTPFFFTTASLTKTWAFKLTPVTSFAGIAPGDPGGVAAAPRQNFLRLGNVSFDGFGMAFAGHTLATTEDNSGSTVVVDFTWQGTYTINSDGTGSLTMLPVGVSDPNCTPLQPVGVCTTFEAPETYAFSLSKSRQRLYLMQTSNTVGAKIFLRGEAEIR